MKPMVAEKNLIKTLDRMFYDELPEDLKGLCMKPENPNIKKTHKITDTGFKFICYINEVKKTVVAIMLKAPDRWIVDGIKAKAKCAPLDTFNEDYGIKLAVDRCVDKFCDRLKRNLEKDLLQVQDYRDMKYFVAFDKPKV